MKTGCSSTGRGRSFFAIKGVVRGGGIGRAFRPGGLRNLAAEEVVDLEDREVIGECWCTGAEALVGRVVGGVPGGGGGGDAELDFFAEGL